MIQNLKVRIYRGCLSGIPSHAATSGNEWLHRRLNYAIHTNHFSQEMAFTRCSGLFFMVNNNDKDITSLLSFPEFPGTSLEDCRTNGHFGVRNNVCIEDSNSAVEGARLSGEYKSLRELTPKETSYIRDIIASSMTWNIGNSYNMPHFREEEHSHSTDGICSAPNGTALEIAVAALNFYSIFNGLEA